MAQSISQEAIVNTGLPGATAASRYAGATASGAPTTGTFAVGDFIVDQTGKFYVCTVAGTPGTWVQVGATTTSVTMGGDVTGNSATSTVAKINGTTLGTLSGATTGQALAWNGSSWVPTTIGGAPGTVVKAYISANVTGAGYVVDLTSISLTAGTWLINYQIEGQNTSSTLVGGMGAYVGPNTGSTTGAYSAIGILIGKLTSGYPYVMSVAGTATVVLASTTTVYLGWYGDTNIVAQKADYITLVSGVTTGIIATKLA